VSDQAIGKNLNLIFFVSIQQLKRDLSADALKFVKVDNKV
jgi:hypothetical protein